MSQSSVSSPGAEKSCYIDIVVARRQYKMKKGYSSVKRISKSYEILGLPPRPSEHEFTQRSADGSPGQTRDAHLKSFIFCVCGSLRRRRSKWPTRGPILRLGSASGKAVMIRDGEECKAKPSLERYEFLERKKERKNALEHSS